MSETAVQARLKPLAENRHANGGVKEAQATLEIVKLLEGKGFNPVECTAALQAALVLCDYRQSSRQRLRDLTSGRYPDDPRRR